MKNAKRLLACLLALAMIFALAACGETPDPTDPSGTTAPADPAPTDPIHSCEDGDGDHKCDICGAVLTECADSDADHKCDICGKVVSLALTGSGEVIDVNTGAPQLTIVNLNADLLTDTATLDIIMPIEGVGNMYLVASEAGTDPAASWLYMMAAIVGKGTVTEAEGGYQVNFAWNAESLNEETGETVSTPMALEILVTETDGVYSAVVNYLDYIVITVDSLVKMTGSGEVIDVNTGAPQLTVVNLNLDLFNSTAALEIIMPIEGVGNMYLVASEAGTDPAASWLYMMAAIVGKGTVTEAEGGYQVNFAWNAESLNEETGETVSTPMALEILVTVTDGAYTATVNYLDYIVIDVAA